MGTLKPQRSGPIYSNMTIGTLVVDGWAVTFGTARRGLGGLWPHPVEACTGPFFSARPGPARSTQARPGPLPFQEDQAQPGPARFQLGPARPVAVVAKKEQF